MSDRFIMALFLAIMTSIIASAPRDEPGFIATAATVSRIVAGLAIAWGIVELGISAWQARVARRRSARDGRA